MWRISTVDLLLETDANAGNINDKPGYAAYTNQQIGNQTIRLLPLSQYI